MGVVESGDNIRNGITDKVFGGVSRNRNLMREIFDSISNTGGMRVRHVTMYTSIMFHRWSNIPTFFASILERSSLIDFLVYDNFSARRCNGPCIEIIWAFYISPSRKSWVTLDVRSRFKVNCA